MNGENSNASVRLTTWKEIAAFLGRDERTVKRWEARGLPVRRVPGSGRASVFAYAHELQQWLDGSSTPLPPPAAGIVANASAARRRLIGSAMAAVLVAAVLGAVLLWRQPTTTDFHTDRKHDPVATEYYQTGMHDWQTRSPAGLKRAIGDFNAAIRQEPDYAEAYAGLANTYNLMREFTLMPPDEAYARARAAALQAVKIDPSLASAHAALGFIAFYWQHDVAGARQEFARAIALDPKNPISHHWNATFLMTTGDFPAARAEIEKAAALDPESAAIVADKALILYYAGDPKQAITLLKQIEIDQPQFSSPHHYLSVFDLLAHDDRGYLQELKLMAGARADAQTTAIVAAGEEGLASGGHNGMLQASLDAKLALYKQRKASAYSLAEAYALLDQQENALTYLAASVARKEPDTIVMKIDPFLASLRGSPAFRSLLAQIGF